MKQQSFENSGRPKLPCGLVMVVDDADSGNAGVSERLLVDVVLEFRLGPDPIPCGLSP
jgi:hypothetical protein